MYLINHDVIPHRHFRHFFFFLFLFSILTSSIQILPSKRKKKKDQVRLYWTGCQPMPIHGRDPTTARHGNFCLLCFHPGPVRPSLDNLDLLSSPERPILMPSLVRTPDRHSTPESRTPALKPFQTPTSK